MKFLNYNKFLSSFKENKDKIYRNKIIFIPVFFLTILIIFVFILILNSKNVKKIQNSNFEKIYKIDEQIIKNLSFVDSIEKEFNQAFALKKELYIDNFYVERFIEKDGIYTVDVTINGEKAYNVLNKINNKKYVFIKNGEIKLFNNGTLIQKITGELIKLNSLERTKDISISKNATIYDYENCIIINSDIMLINIENRIINCFYNTKIIDNKEESLNNKNNIIIKSDYAIINGQNNSITFKNNVDGEIENINSKIKFNGNFIELKKFNNLTFIEILNGSFRINDYKNKAVFNGVGDNHKFKIESKNDDKITEDRENEELKNKNLDKSLLNNEYNVEDLEYDYVNSEVTFETEKDIIHFKGKKGSFYYEEFGKNYKLIINNGFLKRYSSNLYFYSKGSYLDYFYENVSVNNELGKQVKINNEVNKENKNSLFNYNYKDAYNYIIEINEDVSKLNFLNFYKSGNIEKILLEDFKLKNFILLRNKEEIKNYLFFSSKEGNIYSDKYINLNSNCVIKNFINNYIIIGEKLYYDFIEDKAYSKDKVFIYEYKLFYEYNNKKIFFDIFNVNEKKNFILNNLLFEYEKDEIELVEKNKNNPYYFNYPGLNKNILTNILELSQFQNLGQNQINYSSKYFLSRIIKANEAIVNNKNGEYELKNNIKLFDFSNLIYLSCDYIFYEGNELDIYNLENKILIIKWDNEETFLKNSSIGMIQKGEKAKIINKENYAIMSGNPFFINVKDKFIVKSEVMEVLWNEKNYIFKNKVNFIFEQADVDKKRGVFVKGDYAVYYYDSDELNISGNCEIYVDKNSTKAVSLVVYIKKRKIEATTLKEVKLINF